MQHIQKGKSAKSELTNKEKSDNWHVNRFECKSYKHLNKILKLTVYQQWHVTVFYFSISAHFVEEIESPLQMKVVFEHIYSLGLEGSLPGPRVRLWHTATDHHTTKAAFWFDSWCSTIQFNCKVVIIIIMNSHKKSEARKLVWIGVN